MSLFLLAAPVYAHHSLAAEFDLDRPVTVEGTIARGSLDEDAAYYEGKDDDGKDVDMFPLAVDKALIRYQAPGISAGRVIRPSASVNGPCQ